MFKLCSRSRKKKGLLLLTARVVLYDPEDTRIVGDNKDDATFIDHEIGCAYPRRTELSSQDNELVRVLLMSPVHHEVNLPRQLVNEARQPETPRETGLERHRQPKENS
jgi:hypothetical protein